MNWGKLSIAAFVGFLANFLLGWLVYGILLKNAMPVPDGIVIPEADVSIATIAVSCLVWACLLTYILHKSGITTLQSGAITGAVVGGLTSLSWGLGVLAMYTFGSLNNTVVDTLANLVVSGATGAAIAWYLGRK